MHKNGPLEVKDSLTNKKSSAITQRVKENRRQEDAEGEIGVSFQPPPSPPALHALEVTCGH